MDEYFDQTGIPSQRSSTTAEPEPLTAAYDPTRPSRTVRLVMSHDVEPGRSLMRCDIAEFWRADGSNVADCFAPRGDR